MHAIEPRQPNARHPRQQQGSDQRDAGDPKASGKSRFERRLHRAAHRADRLASLGHPSSMITRSDAGDEPVSDASCSC